MVQEKSPHGSDLTTQLTNKSDGSGNEAQISAAISLLAGSYTVHLESFNGLSELTPPTILHEDVLTINVCPELPSDKTETPVDLVVGTASTFPLQASDFLAQWTNCQDEPPTPILPPELEAELSCTEKVCNYTPGSDKLGLIDHIGKTYTITQTIKSGSSSYKLTQPVNVVYRYTNFETTL